MREIIFRDWSHHVEDLPGPLLVHDGSLAEDAGMSVSAFHHNFKAVTATSPLQYLKTIRLHKARLLMAVEGLNAGVAEDRAGYQSASQFSREFKRFFGATPQNEATRVRAMLGLDAPAVVRIE